MTFINKVAALTLLVLSAPLAIATTMNTITIYSDSQCNGTPMRVFMTESANCTNSACAEGEYNGGVQYRTTTCVESDRHEYIAEVFNEVSFVTLDHFGIDGCEDLTFSSTYLAAGTCQSGTTNATVITKLYPNGSASIQAFEGLSCGHMASQFALEEWMISNHTCVQDRYKFYSSTSEEAAGLSTSSSSAGEGTSDTVGSSSASEDSSGITIGGIIGIAIGGCVLLLLCIIACLFMRRRAKEKQLDDQLTTPTEADLTIVQVK
ncbi:hypothetical protein PHYPSEUDO_006381 [Phytophthora pseudosyringae]|uniref:TKL protein kinase n=1 Tax=Phytophthora pseudosyringae TaxID=221518 RepID=A0A8T1WB86_9STRA|nr:hypothetical protein PHYPSEUDO_006381 [Phytophthora pseudosyringae]